MYEFAFAGMGFDFEYKRVVGFWKMIAYVPLSGLLIVMLTMSNVFDYKIDSC